MSASEKLKAIEAEDFAAPWLYDDGTINYDEGGMKNFRTALPQIVAVVEAAEKRIQVGYLRPFSQIAQEELAAALFELEKALS